MRKWLALLLVLTLTGCVPYQPGTKRPAPPDSAPLKVAPISVHLNTQPPVQVSATPLPVPTVVPGDDNVINQLIAVAKTWIGTRYWWGGCSKSGVDCSCFVRNVLAAAGINAPRVTVDQIRWATPVSASAARPMDLVFFDNTCTGCGGNPTHVGIYLGGGQMIDAGDPVHIEPVYSGHNARYGRPPGL